MLDLAYIKQNAMEQAKEYYSSWIAPERVLAMVAEIERLRAERTWLRGILVQIENHELRDHEDYEVIKEIAAHAIRQQPLPAPPEDK
jgi:hypothetical protein